MEKIFLAFLLELLRDESRLTKVIGHGDAAALRQALQRSAELVAGGHETLAPGDLVPSILPKIIVAPQTLSLKIWNQGLCSVLCIPTQETAEPHTVVDLPFTIRRRRVESKLVLAGEGQMPSVDSKPIETIARAHEWRDRLIEGVTVADLAREIGLDDGEISRVLSLAFLAPTSLRSILSGRQPVELTTKHLKSLKPLPLSWAEQRRRLGFPPAM